MTKRNIMRKHILLAAILPILLVLIPVNVFPQVMYDSSKKLISVKSEGKLLSELFSEICAKAKMNVYINPSLDRKVFVDIKNQPIENAIKQIIKPLNSAFVYQGKSVKSVWIFEQSKAEATFRIPPAPTSTASTLSSVKQDHVKKRLLRKQELEAKARERRRQIAASQGKLKEFEEREALREKRRKERDMRREERKKAIERMRAERQERLKRNQSGESPSQ